MEKKIEIILIVFTIFYRLALGFNNFYCKKKTNF